jgi:hypothetical protein
MVNYRDKKTVLFMGLKYHGNLLSYCNNLPLFQGKFNVINIPMIIYCHSTVITKVMLLYNTERWYDHVMAVNYCGKKFHNIGPWLYASDVVVSLPYKLKGSSSIPSMSTVKVKCLKCLE